MKLKILTIIFLGLVPTWSPAQYIPMVEEGKFWIYLNHFDSDHPVAVSGHAITFQGDTIINSQRYKKVYRYSLKGEHNCPYPPCFQFDIPYVTTGKELISFIREDTVSKKVFNLPVLYYGFCDTIEHLIFNYSLGIGDTINVCIYEFIAPNNPPFGIVDSIKATERFGKNRNTIFTTGIQQHAYLPIVGEVLILEGVGLENYGIFHEPLSFLVDFCENGMNACELILSNATIEENKQVNVFPNPTQGALTVTISEPLLGATYTIVDCLGRVTQSFKLTELQFTVQLYDPGIYFWRVEHQSRIIGGGKIICN